MSRAIRFNYVRPYRAAAIMTARAAVLTPTTHPASSDAELYAAMRLLSIRWRVAAQQLYLHGWQPHGRIIREPEDMDWIINCRPPFAEVKQRTPYCQLTSICPYCYARKVANLYDKLRLAMRMTVDEVTEIDLSQDEIPADDEHGRAQRAVFLDGNTSLTSQYRLIERRHEFNVPLFDTDVCREAASKRVPTHGERTLIEAFTPRTRAEREQIAVRLDSCLRALVANRQLLLKAVRPTGAVLYTSAEPWENCWHFEHRQLFILGPGEDLPEQIRAKTVGVVREYDRVNAKQLSLAIRRTFAYPQRLLLGDHGMTAAYLNARAGRQLWASSGIARVASNRVDVDVTESDHQ